MRRLALLAVLATALTACHSPTHRGTGGVDAAAAPKLTVRPVVTGLNFPWDITFAPDRTMLFDERPGAIWAAPPGERPHRVQADLADLFVGSESGLLGMVVDPHFATDRRLYTCQAYKAAGSDPIDLRVIRWTIDADYTKATRDGQPVVTGLPITSGRHGGCRLRFAPDGTLHIGTGDAATGTNPQDLQSLGGKTLRVNPDGSIPRDNPFYARGGNARYVYTYGHRNVQGLALRPGTDEIWTVEHGPDRDDEVNLEKSGANYGWDPVGGVYNESVPMTDLTRFPHAEKAKWSSGFPTIAPSGGTFITGAAWGSYQGDLAVGVLKGTELLLMKIGADDAVTSVLRVPELDGRYGRLRAPQMGPDGALYVTTSNGDGKDEILRVVPAP